MPDEQSTGNPNAKTAQLNLRLRPGDLQAIKDEAAKDSKATGPWCEAVILDRVHERRLPTADVPAGKAEFKADRRKCPHDRLPEPGFGMADVVCPDCGTKIRKIGRTMTSISTR